MQHVLCFDDANPDYTAGEYSAEVQNDLIRFKFNYIYCFCVHFYANLASYKTVKEAFDLAKDQLRDEQVQDEEIW